jgi:hypothetical protein
MTQFIVGCVICCSYYFVEYDLLIHGPGGHTGGLSSTVTMPRSGKEHGIGSHFQVQRVPCLKNSGEALAIWSTTLYCIPLMYLFVSFFRRAYLESGKRHTKSPIH